MRVRCKKTLIDNPRPPDPLFLSSRSHAQSVGHCITFVSSFVAQVTVHDGCISCIHLKIQAAITILLCEGIQETLIVIIQRAAAASATTSHHSLPPSWIRNG